MIVDKYKNLLLIFILSYTVLCLNTATLANEGIEYTNKLIVIYKNFESPARFKTKNDSLKLGTLPFGSVLNNVIQKLTLSGDIKIKPLQSPHNIRFQEANEAVAFVETSLDELNSYVVKVNDESIIEKLKEALEKEDGVEKVTRDFKVQLPDELQLQTGNNIVQSCQATPTCDSTTRRVACGSGTPSCPAGKIPFCIFFQNSPAVAGCLGGSTFNSDEIYCDNGSGPPGKLPNDPYNTENWFYEKTGLLSAWNKTCNCPPEIPHANCNVKDHLEFCKIGDPNIIIAVLDNGFSIGFQPGTTGTQDLTDRWDLNISKNVILGDNPFDYDSSDEPSASIVYDHGTAVALSASASGNNNISHAGINWGSKIWAIRVGKGAGTSLSNILAGVNYVISKVDALNIKHFFINLSYGSVGDCNQFLARALNDFAGLNVKSHGGLITLASGNEGCFQNLEDVAPDVIVVGASVSGSPCSNVDIAGYSNYGKSTDIFSPSGFILDNRNIGVESFQISKQTIHGSSFSAPSLAGYGSLLWSLNPTLTPDQIEKVLKISSLNSLPLFEGNLLSKDKINKSQSSQVKINDAIDFSAQITSLIINTNPNTENQKAFVNENNNVIVSAILPGSNEILNLQALNLPQGAEFIATSGTGSVVQTFSWTPTSQDLNNTLPVTFLIKNSIGKIIGATKIIFTVEGRQNRPPIINAGLDKIVRPKQVVRFDGATATDPDSNQLTYSWTLTEPLVPVLKLNPASLNNAGFYTFGTDIGLVNLKFTLTVSDGGTQVSDEVIYTVKNFPPTADAGPDRFSRRGSYLRLGGVGNTDPDLDPLSYTWTQTNGPSVPIFYPNTQNPIIKAPTDLSTPGNEAIFKLKVDDGLGGASTDNVSIFVVR